ncbi:hypothetical protein ACLB6G_01110 [Zhengella sp. ZM62]|uniref:hypothetical protein n=1 Tax=Zhengella sedimenti TaxID=3390035 RepID=UPI003975F307
MKRMILAAFAASAALSTAAFAEEPPQLYGNYSAAVQDEYNKGPAERNVYRGGYADPMLLDTMPTASIPDNSTMAGEAGEEPNLDYGPAIEERDINR